MNWRLALGTGERVGQLAHEGVFVCPAYMLTAYMLTCLHAYMRTVQG